MFMVMIKNPLITVSSAYFTAMPVLEFQKSPVHKEIKIGETTQSGDTLRLKTMTRDTMLLYLTLCGLSLRKFRINLESRG